jgi:NAD+ diphosphatase
MESDPPTVHAFAGSILDRRAELRGSGRKTRAVRLAGDKAVVEVRDSGKHQLALFEAAGGMCVHLGIGPDGDAIVAEETKPCELPEGQAFIDLRSLAMQGLLARGELAMLAQARSLLSWHASHRFCANCGEPTQMAEHGYRRDCGRCKAQHFPRTDPVAIVAVRRRSLCLLGRGHAFLPGMYSALAGFIEPGESIEEAARRELFEETGVVVGSVRYHSSQPWPFPSSLMIGLLAEGLSDEIRLDASEIADARWFTRAEIELMFAERHPQGLRLPKPAAIAHSLIREAAGIE